MGVYSLQDELCPSQLSPSPSPLVVQKEPGDISGSPCVANPLQEIGCLVCGGGGTTHLERFKSRHRGCTCARCASTHMPKTHAHPRTGTHTPISSCLLALLALISLCFPEAAPTSGTAESRTASRPRLQREERERAPYKPVPALSPIASPKGFKFIERQEGSCSESEEVASHD